jgi:hypothetical protein
MSFMMSLMLQEISGKILGLIHPTWTEFAATIKSIHERSRQSDAPSQLFHELADALDKYMPDPHSPATQRMPWQQEIHEYWISVHVRVKTVYDQMTSLAKAAMVDALQGVKDNKPVEASRDIQSRDIPPGAQMTTLQIRPDGEFIRAYMQLPDSKDVADRLELSSIHKSAVTTCPELFQAWLTVVGQVSESLLKEKGYTVVKAYPLRPEDNN